MIPVGAVILGGELLGRYRYRNGNPGNCDPHGGGHRGRRAGAAWLQDL